MVNMCRKCFKLYVDPLASDAHLLEGTADIKCEGCGGVEKTIISYFKYGEHIVDTSGKLVEPFTKHVGIDLTAPIWKEST